jgi:hypothetical protein
VRQAGPREKAALGNQRRCTTIIHRTVRWCTGLSGESSAANSSLSGNEKGDMATIHRTVQWCTGLSGEPTVASATVVAQSAGDAWPAATVGWAHRTVRCAPCTNRSRGPTVGCARKRKRSRTGQLQGLPGGAPEREMCLWAISKYFGD